MNFGGTNTSPISHGESIGEQNDGIVIWIFIVFHELHMMLIQRFPLEAFHEFSCISIIFIDFHEFPLIFIDVPSPGAWRSGGLWRAVAACCMGVVAPLEDCIMEAWSPGGL